MLRPVTTSAGEPCRSDRAYVNVDANATVYANGVGDRRYGGTVTAIGPSFDRAERLPEWSRQARGGGVIRRTCGMLVVAAALGVICSA